jgi:hypothetical protein
VPLLALAVFGKGVAGVPSFLEGSNGIEALQTKSSINLGFQDHIGGDGCFSLEEVRCDSRWP